MVEKKEEEEEKRSEFMDKLFGAASMFGVERQSVYHVSGLEKNESTANFPCTSESFQYTR